MINPIIEFILFFLVYAISLFCVYQIASNLVKKRYFKDSWFAFSFIRALPKPSLLLLTIIFIKIGTHRAGFTYVIEPLDVSTQRVLDIMILLSIVWFLLRWKEIAYETHVRKKKNLTVTASLYTLSRAASAIIALVTIVTILNMLNVNMTAIWTIGGVGAAAIAFASRDVIGNLFGGLTLMLTRPFGLKDHIIIPSQDIDGWVKEIGWYLTLLDNRHKELIYVPNQIFTGSHLVNLSRRTHRYIDWSIGVRYQDLPLIDNICQSIESHIQTLEDIDQDDRYAVILDMLDESSINIRITAYCNMTNWRSFQIFKHELMLKVIEIIHAEGADFPFPTRRVLVDRSDNVID